MTILAKGAALLVAAFGVALGLWFFVSTEAAAAAFFLTPQGTAGLATLRADMSAFFLVGGLAALYAALTGRGRALLIPALLYGIGITGRAVNLIVVGSSPGAAVPMVVEAILIALSLFGWLTLRANAPGRRPRQAWR